MTSCGHQITVRRSNVPKKHWLRRLLSPTLTRTRKPISSRTYASSVGIGFVLMQKQTEDEWKIVQVGSRFITGTAVIELECLAIAWAIKKCHIFLSGSDHFTVITDHNPLMIPVLNSHCLDEIENPRLQRLRTCLMGYNFTARWLKGAKNQAADALSRHPYCKPTQGDDLAEFDLLNGEAPFISSKIASALVVSKCRLLIPTSLRATMLSRLHEAHQGIARSQARARLTI